MVQAFAASVCVTVALVGLVASNLLRDRGVPRALARYVAPWCAGAAFLIAALSLEPDVAIPLAVVLAVMLVVLKAFRRTALRGVEGELPSQAWSEITFGHHRVALASPAALSPQAINAIGRNPNQGSPSQPQPTARLVTPESPNVISDHA